MSHAPTAPQQSQRGPSRKLKIIGGAIGALLLIGLIGQCSGSSKPTPAASSSSASTAPSSPAGTTQPERTTSSSPPATTTAQAPAQKAESAARKAVGERFRAVDAGSGRLLVGFNISDNLTSNLQKVGAQRDTYEILKSIHESTPGTAVTVQGFFPMVDKLGNESTIPTLTAVYDAATLDKINWSNMDRSRIWGAATSVVIHPGMGWPNG